MYNNSLHKYYISCVSCNRNDTNAVSAPETPHGFVKLVFLPYFWRFFANFATVKETPEILSGRIILVLVPN